MKYCFDEIIDRRNTDSIKWDHIPGNPDANPMWVADMDFRCPPTGHRPGTEKPPRRLRRSYRHTPGLPGGHCQLGSAAATIGTWERLQPSLPSVVPALYTAVAAFTEPGDRVILQRPVYGPFTDAATQQGREISNNAPSASKRHYEVTSEDLERCAADPRAKLMLLCSPHNPVGKVFTRQELEKLGKFAATMCFLLCR